MTRLQYSATTYKKIIKLYIKKTIAKFIYVHSLEVDIYFRISFPITERYVQFNYNDFVLKKYIFSFLKPNLDLCKYFCPK